MKKLILLLITLISTLAFSQPFAFEGAYGGASSATGGRGNVYHVTNLSGDYSTGSMLWAVTQPRPATVICDVSGTIDMGSNFFQISGKDLTIAGQTAPLGGITITSSDPNWKVRLWDVENIIIRYIRIRYQSGNGNIGVDIYGNVSQARNIIFDHCSLSYAGWTGFGLRGTNSYNNTVQNCIIAECKTGALWGDSDTSSYSYDNSFNGNYFYNVSHRFPNPNGVGRIDVINNVVQNPFYRQASNTHSPQLNHINNYVAAGSWSSMGYSRMNRDFDNQNNQIYSSGNIIDKDIFENAAANNQLIWSKWAAGSETAALPAANFTSTQWALLGNPYPIKTAVQAYNDVITNPHVGASKTLNADGTTTLNYDANDTAYLAKIAEGEGAYEVYDTSTNWQTTPPTLFTQQRYLDFIASISSTPINTRPAAYDTDADGMPDVWEVATFGDLTRNGTGDLDSDGYTDLEEFLNLVDGNYTPPPPTDTTSPTPAAKGKLKRSLMLYNY